MSFSASGRVDVGGAEDKEFSCYLLVEGNLKCGSIGDSVHNVRNSVILPESIGMADGTE
jgi:hypothetical protein